MSIYNSPFSSTSAGWYPRSVLKKRVVIRIKTTILEPKLCGLISNRFELIFFVRFLINCSLDFVFFFENLFFPSAALSVEFDIFFSLFECEYALVYVRYQHSRLSCLAVNVRWPCQSQLCQNLHRFVALVTSSS